MNVDKPNCYECRWRGTLVGDEHSCCNHPALSAGNGAIKWIVAQGFYVNQRCELFNVTADPLGIRRGWFMWPINYDPVWLLTCDAFERKEVEPDDKDKAA